jgi:hypothetical protein
MEHIKTFENGKLSLWQAAVEEVISKRAVAASASEASVAGAAVARPDMNHPLEYFG